MRTLLIGFAIAAGTSAFSQVYFYGGDFDQRNGWTAQTGPFDGRIYDDFNASGAITVTGMWGNYLDGGGIYTTAEYEIRTGVSTGNGGTLIASGTASTTTVDTGRSAFGLIERQVSISGLNINLGAGTYFMSLAIVNTGSSMFVSSTSGTNVGPGGDPNPAVTGSPIANGNSFFNSTFYGANFADMFSWAGTGEQWDWSYGINAVPEPSSIAILGIALGGLVIAKRRKR